MTSYDNTRVRTRIVPLDPRETFLGQDYAWDPSLCTWIRPPVSTEGLYKYTTQDIWYRKAETCADEVHKGPPWSSGGPFTKIKLSAAYFDKEVQGFGRHGEDMSAVQFFTGLGYRNVMYVGGFLPLWPNDSLLPQPFRGMWDTTNLLKLSNNSLIPSLTGWGPKAWAATAPKIEMAPGFVALAESRDLPHMLKQSSKDFHKIWRGLGGSFDSPKMAPKAASETFLNHQFGWSPFLSDMQKFYNAYQNTAAYMSRMSHGNNKWKVYRRTLLNTYSSNQILAGTNWSLYPGSQAMQNQMVTGPMKWEIRDERSTLITTSGRFKWYNSNFDLNNTEYNSAWNRIGRQLTMYGLRVSPSNIWRSTPWTWLIDWGLNVGRSIDRLQEQLLDGVVSQYLYLMHHDIHSLVMNCTIPFKAGDVTLKFYRSIEVKQRREAGSPYGFDLSWETLSPMRLAILAALGITRSTPR